MFMRLKKSDTLLLVTAYLMSWKRQEEKIKLVATIFWDILYVV